MVDKDVLHPSNKVVLITMIILNSSPPSLINTVFFYVLNPYLFLSNYVIIVGIEKNNNCLCYGIYAN